MIKHQLPTLPLDEIARILKPFYRGLTKEQATAIRRYVDKLLFWNQSVSLTSIEDPAEIVARHFGESLFAASVASFESGRLADVGSGAGFPGLPLKILYPMLEVTLLEPNKKKCAFLSEVCQILSVFFSNPFPCPIDGFCGVLRKIICIPGSDGLVVVTCENNRGVQLLNPLDNFVRLWAIADKIP